MIYTVGHKKTYLDAMRQSGTILKMSKTADYEGGWVFRTQQEAEKFIADGCFDKGYTVFGLRADWEKDTDGDLYLLTDAEIVVL